MFEFHVFSLSVVFDDDDVVEMDMDMDMNMNMDMDQMLKYIHYDLMMKVQYVNFDYQILI
jgi:hypothetical protein